MKIILKLLLAGCAFALAACGTVQTSTPMPSMGERLSVTAVIEPLSLNEIPVGTYRVPDSMFAVRKYMEISKTAGAFGAAGVLAAHSSGADDSKASVDGVEGIFRFDMAAETMRVMKGLRAQGHGASNLVLDGTADGGTLRLRPHAYLTTKDGSTARLYVFLKVQLLDKRGSEQWWTRYTYYVPGEYPIKGRGSWSANNGQLLREKVAEGLAEAGKVLLKTSGQASAWNEKPVKMKMRIPGLDDVLTLDGTVLQQTDKTVIVSPKITTAALFYGVSIIPRNEVELSPL
jgi:hypothetical protein